MCLFLSFYPFSRIYKNTKVIINLNALKCNCRPQMRRITINEQPTNNDLKHILPMRSFQKIFNRNTAKISYSCMRNMNSIISAHNRTTLNSPKTNYGCNCRNKTKSALQNQCLTPNIIYQADLSNNVDSEKRVNLGVSETPFQERYSNHPRDAKHERYCNATKLSKYVRELKRNNKVPIITLKIARKVYGNPKNKALGTRKQIFLRLQQKKVCCNRMKICFRVI